MNPSPPPDKLREIRSLIATGRKIDAIKVYREFTGLGLKEAKDAIEQMAADEGAAIPAGLPTNTPKKSGCLGMVALLVGGGCLAVWILR